MISEAGALSTRNSINPLCRGFELKRNRGISQSKGKLTMQYNDNNLLEMILATT